MFIASIVLGIGALCTQCRDREGAGPRFSNVSWVTGGEFGRVSSRALKTTALAPGRFCRLKTSPDFSSLQLCDFSPELWKETRAIRGHCCSSLNEFKPDVLVTALFPFGRKHFRFELLPLLEQPRSPANTRRTLVVSSVRDILVARKGQEEYGAKSLQSRDSFTDLVLSR